MLPAWGEGLGLGLGHRNVNVACSGFEVGAGDGIGVAVMVQRVGVTVARGVVAREEELVNPALLVRGEILRSQLGDVLVEAVSEGGGGPAEWG